jgi:ABC-type multidrug transport system ATPase subunit
MSERAALDSFTEPSPIEVGERARAAQAVLTVRGLCRSFGEHVVLNDLGLTILRGERVALFGPNGSGKSTLLRCIAGTLTPTRGSIHIAGHAAGSMEARRLTGASFSQERSFYLRLSGRANLLFFARLRGHKRSEADRVVDALEHELELSHILPERVDRCSTGMVQQLAFARALLSDPPLLLLDEPTRSLDAAAIARLWAALERRPGTASLIASHLETDVDRCERVVELSPKSS